FAMTTPFGGGAASAVLASLTGGITMDVTIDLRQLRIVQIPREGLPTVGTIELDLSQATTFHAVIDNTPRTGLTSDPPVIQSANLEFTATGPDLVLTGNRFIYDNPLAPAAKKTGSLI